MNNSIKKLNIAIIKAILVLYCYANASAAVRSLGSIGTPATKDKLMKKLSETQRERIKRAKRMKTGRENKITVNKQLFNSVAGLVDCAKRKISGTINEEMVVLYWNIGKTIKEEIIKSDRAEYGNRCF